MAEFNISGGPSSDELGQSLLQDARAQSARRRRQERGSTKDAVANLLLGVAGQYIGSTVTQNFNDKLNTFVNSENVLTERALSRSAVDESKRLVERDQLANNSEVGRREYYRTFLENDISSRVNERLSQMGGVYNQTDIAQFAKLKAADHIDEYLTGVDKQLAAAQNVISTTGGERTAYFEALRNERGANEGFLGKMFRNVNSSFNDETDANTDRAVHRGAISSRIYQTSETFKSVYDDVRKKSGSAAIASSIAESLDLNEARIRKAKAVPEYFEMEVDGKKTGGFITKTPEGNPVSFSIPEIVGGKLVLRHYGMETMAALGGSSGYGKRKVLDPDAAFEALETLASQLPEDLYEDVLETSMRNLSSFGGTEASEKTIQKVRNGAASEIHFYKKGLEALGYSDAGLSPAQLSTIAARAYVATKNEDTVAYSIFRGDPDMMDTNPLVTYQSIVDMNDVSPEIKDLTRSTINHYMVEVLPNRSPQFIQNFIDYVEQKPRLANLEFYLERDSEGFGTGSIGTTTQLAQEALKMAQDKYAEENPGSELVLQSAGSRFALPPPKKSAAIGAFGNYDLSRVN
jgi:hypothetical protein